MNFHQYIENLKTQKKLLVIEEEISRDLEIAAVLKKLEPRPILFQNVKGFSSRMVGNLCCTKVDFASILGIQPHEIIPRLVEAINHPKACPVVTNAPCQEIVEINPDLDKFPLLRHFPSDGGYYITSGIMIAHHPIHGQNVDFHRLMQFSKKEMAVRVVRSRHFDIFLNDLQQVEVAVCIGLAPNIMVAAATSVDLGVNELEIANAMQSIEVVRAKTIDVLIPAESEIVLEGVVYLNRRHPEGPFVDLTETQDIIRQEPVFEIKAITYRKDAIWQALLPGGLEHKLLMGMPREPTIFKSVSQVVRCLDVNINPGGCSWLHAIIKIEKQTENDGIKAIQAAFSSHRSCKHVFVVDQDIDIYNPLDVEWAMATRFQADRDLVFIGREQGSSLDPSSDPNTHSTMKLGFDLTHPIESHGKSYSRVSYPDIDLARFLPFFSSKDLPE